jgi:steroid delta-isomerase-like uncharacterized protein
MGVTENKARIEQWVATAWNGGDYSLAGEIYAADYVYHDPACPEDIHGPEGISEMVRRYRAGLTDMQFTIEDMIADGDKVVWRWTARALHRGTLMGIPATGAAAIVTGVVISRFSADKWAEDYCHWDTFGLLRQLGVVPASAQPVG